LGKFQLTGIPPAPRGVPQIEVMFEIDANGILKVSAKDKGTAREQGIRITNTGGLSQSQIEQMRQEAEVYADQDKHRMQLVELKNQADSLFYSYETTLRDNSEFISDDLKAQTNEKVVALKAALADKSITVEEMTTRIDALREAIYTLGSAVYQQTGAPSSSSGSTPPGVGMPPNDDTDFADDDTVTADYEAID